MNKLSREEVLDKVQRGEDLSGFDLRGIDLQKADLPGANLKGAQLRYANLSGADLSKADLREANLRHALMLGVNLSEADLRDADLTHADLSGSNLVNTKTSGAKMEGSKGISNKVFFTQKVLDSLNDEDKIKIDGNRLAITGPDGLERAYEVVPAFRFLKQETEGEDKFDLVGKVKTEKEVKEMGVDAYANSAIYNDIVYEIESGFIGVPIAALAAADAAAASGKPEEAQKAQAAAKSDEDLLADFMMKHLPGF